VRRAARALLWLVLLAGGFFAWARLLHAGPLGPIPWQARSRATGRPTAADWSFANREPYLLVESALPAAPVGARFLAHGGRLHLLLPGFFGDDLARRLDVDPRVRVEIDGKLYEQVAVAVTDDAHVGELMAPVLRRQFAIEIGGSVRRVPGATRAALAVYRLEDPAP
jgi:hypothetical protein